VPYFGSNTNAEFGNGLNYVTSPGRSNENSIVLDGALQADGDEWNSAVGQVATTPHSVLAPYSFSRNASANASDGSNFIPGCGYAAGDGSSNGESTQTFDQNLRLRQQGDTDAGMD
jgi:hypothetical protein